MLAAHGHIDQLQLRVNGGDEYAADHLAQWLVERGRVDEAIAVLRKMANAWNGSGVTELLVERGRAEELEAEVHAGTVGTVQRLPVGNDPQIGYSAPL